MSNQNYLLYLDTATSDSSYFGLKQYLNIARMVDKVLTIKLRFKNYFNVGTHFLHFFYIVNYLPICYRAWLVLAMLSTTQ